MMADIIMGLIVGAVAGSYATTLYFVAAKSR